MEKCTKIIDAKFGRTDEFEVVNEWPFGYVVWNIGRSNFPHPGYLPLAKVKADYYVDLKVDLKKLKALYVGDETLCLKVLNRAGYHTVTQKTFNEIKGGEG